MKKVFSYLLLMVSIIGFSQEEQLNWKQLESLPYYDFKKGIGITTPDSLYQVQMRFRMQNRFEGDLTNDNQVKYSTEIRRLRLRFDGYVVNPKFAYTLQLSFSPGDVGGSNVNIIRDAMVYYRPDKHWSLGFGQTKLPGNRQRVNSSGALQLTDRSISNATFNIDRDFGIFVSYQNTQSFGYNVKTAITSGQGRNFTGEDKGLAYTGRIELFPFGRFKKGGEFFEGDLKREEAPKLYIGSTYHFNNRATKTQGQRGDKLLEERDLHSFFADAVLKYNGWALMSSYMQRTTSNPITSDGVNNVYVQAGYGFDAQASYVFTNQWEIAGRYSCQVPQSELLTFIPKQNELALGITKYIWEHTFKAQLEVARNEKIFLVGASTDDWYLRFQIEIGI
ncbi:OprO/OprP family phosphate-selective porin [Capnocytophaga catalasegens]|nr:OprO/OprP family phosphate-selective porin [Capnocytophaga catalasegens]